MAVCVGPGVFRCVFNHTALSVKDPKAPFKKQTSSLRHKQTSTGVSLSIVGLFSRGRPIGQEQAPQEAVRRRQGQAAVGPANVLISQPPPPLCIPRDSPLNGAQSDPETR